MSLNYLFAVFLEISFGGKKKKGMGSRAVWPTGTINLECNECGVVTRRVWSQKQIFLFIYLFHFFLFFRLKKKKKS